MTAKTTVKHIIIVVVLIVMLVVIPVTSHFDFFAAGDTDDITGASLEVPDAPDGEFIILMNRSLHADSLADWEVFFSGEELPVIFDDVECLVAYGDTAGAGLAERYMIQLPENQMKLRYEDGTMLASKAENGIIDMAIFSEGMADALQIDPLKAGDDVIVIRVKGSSESSDSGEEDDGQ